MSETYPLAREGVFLTAQGEGVMVGVPMVFVRLAGCSVGCHNCDTDYRVHERATAREIVRRVVNVAAQGVRWVWITGGEPTDHNLSPLIGELRRSGYRVAIATAGTRDLTAEIPAIDFLSVSPHSISKWVHRYGTQLNLVPGLNGLRLEDVEPIVNSCDISFRHRYVTPLWYGPGDRMENMEECLKWVLEHPGWRLGIQAHKAWKLP